MMMLLIFHYVKRSSQGTPTIAHWNLTEHSTVSIDSFDSIRRQHKPNKYKYQYQVIVAYQ
jgi:hypothetical protein